MSGMKDMFKTKFSETFPDKELPVMKKGLKGYYNKLYTLDGPLLSWKDSEYYLNIMSDLSEMINEDKVFFIVGASVESEDFGKYTCGGNGSYAFSFNMLVYFPIDDKFYIHSYILFGNESCDGTGNVNEPKIQEYDDWVKLPGNEEILEMIFIDSKLKFW